MLAVKCSAQSLMVNLSSLQNIQAGQNVFPQRLFGSGENTVLIRNQSIV